MIWSYFAAWKHCPVYRQHTGQEEQGHEQLVTRTLLLLSWCSWFLIHYCLSHLAAVCLFDLWRSVQLWNWLEFCLYWWYCSWSFWSNWSCLFRSFFNDGPFIGSFFKFLRFRFRCRGSHLCYFSLRLRLRNGFSCWRFFLGSLLKFRPLIVPLRRLLNFFFLSKSLSCWWSAILLPNSKRRLDSSVLAMIPNVLLKCNPVVINIDFEFKLIVLWKTWLQFMTTDIVILERSDQSVGINCVISKGIVNTVLSLDYSQPKFNFSWFGDWRQVEVETAGSDGKDIEAIRKCKLSRDGNPVFVELLCPWISIGLPLKTEKR